MTSFRPVMNHKFLSAAVLTFFAGLSALQGAIIITIPDGDTTLIQGDDLLINAAFSGDSFFSPDDGNASTFDGPFYGWIIYGNTTIDYRVSGFKTGVASFILAADSPDYLQLFTDGNTYTATLWVGGRHVNLGTGEVTLTENVSRSLDIAVVPEPSSAFLLGLCSLAFVRARRRNRQEVESEPRD